VWLITQEVSVFDNNNDNNNDNQHFQSRERCIDITDKVALVTGAGSGIGQATAVGLARCGAKAIAIADISQQGLFETAELIAKEEAQSLQGIVDVTDHTQLTRFLKLVESKFGCPSIMHNNAGTICGEPIWPDSPLDKITQVVSVNLLGVIYGTRLGIQMMAKHGGGVIINTASTAALGPMPTDPIYSGTKAAVVNLTQSCAGLAQTHNIRVNAVLPGMVSTPFIERTGDGSKPAAWLKPILEQIPMLTPEQIANGVIQLIRDELAAGACLVIENATEKNGPPKETLLPDARSFYQYQASR